MTCDGCGEPGADCYLRFNAPLGTTGVHVHRKPECANIARELRGGGKWLPRDEQTEALELPPQRSEADERLLAGIRDYAAHLKGRT